MKIKRVNSKQIRVYNSKAEVFVLLKEDTVRPSAERFFVLGETKDEAEQAVSVKGPGEYEYGVVEVIAVETKESPNGTADIYKIIMNRVGCAVIVGEVAKLNKENIDLLGEVNILVVGGHAVQQSDALIKKISPNTILVYDVDKGELEKTLSLEVTESIPTYSAKASDFGDEESAVQVIELK